MSSTAAVRFAAACAILTASHEVADHWVNAAKAVSTPCGVVLPGGC